VSRSSGGDVLIWHTNGNGAVSAITSPGQRPDGFTSFGTGNFNSTLGDDILLRSAPGQLAIWLTGGIGINPPFAIGNTSPDYHNAGIGDFTDDGQNYAIAEHHFDVV